MAEHPRNTDGLVLVVEDDRNQIHFLKRAFARLRIPNPLHVVSDGQQAVLYLSDKNHPSPALVLLDLMVPRIRGLKVLEWMRLQPHLRDTAVVIVTTSIEPEDRRRADQLGVLAYLCKPVFAEGLRELMDMVPWLVPAGDPARDRLGGPFRAP
jgi:CheY-like chemotaxis protein